MTSIEDMVPIRPNKWIGSCWTTASGKEICYSFPTWELPEPEFLVPIPPKWPPVPFPVLGSGPVENPRPVPWITDLSRIAAAWGLIDSVSNVGAAESMRASLKSAAEAITAEAMPEITLHFPT